ncbi:RagB/SusD family nutrient uptake outer membrane protein [Pedobacter heparinus]|uniref:RagB/SusD domain protein n=1 Tax=Pedobacter heparinus (strain ATCC 13125 / DSM 2366 / CIP 104194 / JCM 7457 / NBRC 12017 / NCIMB 9290 / NRRL B-14731 / HIM 762-3) TaxID=485917 RepID=C6Y0Z5_PEDHD|nr:RagB/SusD family nutrient uptake outer membrane protein [Pedobacter heparinus]ACU04922.1 RagB/SusD domain protein [Pedobacter heparinus DSM 2366]
MKSLHKNILSCFLALAGIFSLASCEKELDKTPESQLSDADFWNNTEDLKLAANYFYSYLPVIQDNINANWSDDGFANGGANAISDGSRTVPATSTDWSDNYKLIYNCNNLLEKSVRVKGDQKLIDRYRAEASFFRAFAYANLVKRFGDVPLILRTFDVSDTLNQAHRTPRQAVVDVIYTDLDFAAANLPASSALPAAEYGRITSGAALSLKARVALHEGTLKKFHGKGDPAKDLGIAVTASETVMKSGLYSIFRYAAKPDSSFYYLFQPANEAPVNKEAILVRLYGENLANPIAFHNFPAELGAGSNTTPTKALMDAYLYTDGLPQGKSPLQKTETTTLTQFENRDPRMGMTVFNKTHYYVTSFYLPTLTFAPTGYKVRKYFNTVDFIAKRSFVDNMTIRYAEILLIYAEAKFELNGSISDDDLNKSINLIRSRAKMPALTNAFVTANGLDMRNEIRRERRIELAVEGQHRYWDLIRWKTAEIELPKLILGARFFANEFEKATPKLDAQGYIIVQEAAKRKFNPERDYLWPLPTRDLGLNLSLTQNPRWQ